MTTMNQYIQPQRKLDHRSVSKVDGPAKVDGNFNRTPG